jgi:hypothetical protein
MKKVFVSGLILLIVASLSSCFSLLLSGLGVGTSSNPLVNLVMEEARSTTYELTLDEYSPAENNTLIIFDNDKEKGWFVLKEWNGISLTTALYKGKKVDFQDTVKLTLPSGESSFVFDVTRTRTSYNQGMPSIVRKVEDIEISYLFEQGREYTIKGRSEGLVNSTEYLSLYDTTEDSEILVTEWKISDLLAQRYKEQFSQDS